MRTHPQITSSHLSRRVAAYIRQSSPGQVRDRTGSTAIQRDLPSLLQDLGWASTQIDVIDGDLGVSASIPESRREFNSLLEMIRADVYGAVAVTDDSRLIRNLWDLARFATIAHDHDTLLIQPSRITNFKNPHDELIGVILGATAVFQNRTRTDQARETRMAKARQGKAITRPPVGYVKSSGGLWEKDPDPRVREVIALVFDKFSELGTVGRVSRYFLANDIKLPRRRGPDA